MQQQLPQVAAHMATQLAQNTLERMQQQMTHTAMQATSHVSQATLDAQNRNQEFMQYLQQELPRMVTAQVMQATGYGPAVPPSLHHPSEAEAYPMQGMDIETGQTSLEHYPTTSGDKTRNPKLPTFDGSGDIDLWLQQVDVAFQANNIPESQHVNWLRLAQKDQLCSTGSSNVSQKCCSA